MVTVPERLDKRIGKTERHEIIYGSLAQIVVNAKDLGFIKCPKQNSVQLLGCSKIMPEWFFHDDPCTAATIRFSKVLDNVFKEERGDCEVMRGMVRIPELST